MFNLNICLLLLIIITNTQNTYQLISIYQYFIDIN